MKKKKNLQRRKNIKINPKPHFDNKLAGRYMDINPYAATTRKTNRNKTNETNLYEKSQHSCVR